MSKYALALMLCLTVAISAPADLVFVEIMYNPASTDDNAWEYVELYNNGTTDVDLSGYVLDDEGGTPLTAANIAGGTVPAGNVAILFNGDLNTVADMEAAWGAGINFVPVTNWSALNNGGDRFAIWEDIATYGDKDFTAALEELTYDDSGDWPADDGTASIYLVDIDSDNNNGLNWSLSAVGLDGAYESEPAGENEAVNVGSPGILPDVAVTGACCYDDLCDIVTEDFCVNTLGGFYLGNNTVCGPGVCAELDCATDLLSLRTIPVGDLPVPAKVCNVVVASVTDLSPSESFRSFTVQDATGGLTIYGLGFIIDELFNFPIAEGDEITIEGTLDQFNGLLELTNSDLRYIRVVSNNGQVGVPAPTVVTATDFADGSPTAEAFESTIVTLECASFIDAGTFEGQQNYTVVTADGQVTVRIATDDLDIVGQMIPEVPVNITGIFSQFDFSEPFDGFYQLMPRSMADIVANPDCVGGDVGACCLPAFDCVENTTELDCQTLGGVWYINESCDICPDPVPSDGLLITEVVDGNLPGGIPKWVEITNRGTETIDLSNHSIGNYNNGNLTLGGDEATQLSGMLMPGDSFVYEYDNPVGSRFEEVYGFASDQFSAPDGEGTSGRFVNGDDVIALFLGVGRTDSEGNLISGQIIDVYGVIGVDGTDEVWEYADGYSCRLATGEATDTFDPAEWTFGGPDSLDSGNGEADDIILLQTLTTPAVDACGDVDPCEGQLLGDANCDSVVNNFDIDAFVLALTSGQEAWETTYGTETCTFFCVNDINGDDSVNNFDIDAFVALLTGK